MKKQIFAILLTCSFISAKSDVTIHRSNFGLFRTWYNYVEQSNDALGNYIVSCSDPGFTRCRPIMSGIVFPGDPTPLNDANYAAIEDYVDAHLSPTNTSGTFIYNSEYYILYSYNEETDIQTTRILSIAEAQTLHYIN